jgi:hypothetical protein
VWVGYGGGGVGNRINYLLALWGWLVGVVSKPVIPTGRLELRVCSLQLYIVGFVDISIKVECGRIKD